MLFTLGSALDIIRNTGTLSQPEPQGGKRDGGKRDGRINLDGSPWRVLLRTGKGLC